ncbi:MAG: hypothetical protein ACYC54_14955 [Sedimentisphaerales bacterium]
MIIRAITKSRNSFKVYFDNGKLLKLEFQNNDFYQGYSCWMDYWGINDLDIEAGKILNEKIINYANMPPIIQAHIERVLSETG